MRVHTQNRPHATASTRSTAMSRQLTTWPLVLGLLIAAIALPRALHAQRAAASQFSGSITLMNTQPLGGLRTGPGFGLAASGAWAIDPGRFFRIRADLRGASYGHEQQEFCISQTIGCWIRTDVNTDYTFAYAGLGPEIALPLVWDAQLVLDATAGIGYFGVSSSLEGVDERSTGIGTTTHHEDAVFAWSAGGELRIPLSRQIAITGGAHYLHNGPASYVVEGDITRNPDGTLTVDPTTTDANMVAITLGVAFQPWGGR